MTQPVEQPLPLTEAAADAFQAALEGLESAAVRIAADPLKKLRAALLRLLTTGGDVQALIGQALAKPDDLVGDRDALAEQSSEAQNLAYRRGASTLMATGFDGLLPQPVVREDQYDTLVDVAQTGLQRAQLMPTPEAAIGAVGATAGWVQGRAAAEINKASTDTLTGLAQGVPGAAELWQAERNACVHCLSRAGGFRLPSGEFGYGPNGAFAKKPNGPIEAPPEHPHCRCTLIVGLRGGLEGLATAFAREAARSILQGDRLPSESESVRLGAAEALLKSGGAGLPKTVQARARKAVKARAFRDARARRLSSTKPRATEPIKPAKPRVKPTPAPEPVTQAAEPRELTSPWLADPWPQRVGDVAEGEIVYSDAFGTGLHRPENANLETGRVVATRQDGFLFVIELGQTPAGRDETPLEGLERSRLWREQTVAGLKLLPESQQRAASGYALTASRYKTTLADASPATLGLRFFRPDYNELTLHHENGHLVQFRNVSEENTPIVGAGVREVANRELKSGDRAYGGVVKEVKPVGGGFVTIVMEDGSKLQRVSGDERSTVAANTAEGVLSWRKARELDQALSARFEDLVPPHLRILPVGATEGEDWPVTIGTDAVTEYGSTHWREDFAEAASFYAADQKSGYLFEHAGRRYRFAEIWPNRAKIFDHLEANAHVGHAH